LAPVNLDSDPLMILWPGPAHVTDAIRNHSGEVAERELSISWDTLPNRAVHCPRVTGKVGKVTSSCRCRSSACIAGPRPRGPS